MSHELPEPNSRELSNREALFQLGKNSLKYLPRLYLDGLKSNPSLTMGVTIGTIGAVKLLNYRCDEAAVIAGIGLATPLIGLIANTVEVSSHLWNLYKKRELDQATILDLWPKRNWF